MQLEKRYALPEQPHILVHPSRTAKSGKFDCTVMSLSLLLDYRPEDTKEHSFEVSLFAELFNEMLMRDFGFNIYKALYELPEKLKDKKKKEDEKKGEDDKKKEDEKKKDDDKKKDDKEKKDDKDRKEDRDKKSEDHKDDRRSERREDDKRKEKKEDKKSELGDSEEDDEYEDDDSNKKKDKKKKERPKMFTKDRNLLLSFVYFDQTHCGYIFEKDIEELLYTLGLSLSRAQVRKLVGKVISRDSLHYRKLTDMPKEDFIVIDDSEKECDLHHLACGNKKLLPVFCQGEPPTKKFKSNENNGNEFTDCNDGKTIT